MHIFYRLVINLLYESGILRKKRRLLSSSVTNMESPVLYVISHFCRFFYSPVLQNYNFHSFIAIWLSHILLCVDFSVLFLRFVNLNSFLFQLLLISFLTSTVSRRLPQTSNMFYRLELNMIWWSMSGTGELESKLLVTKLLQR